MGHMETAVKILSTERQLQGDSPYNLLSCILILHVLFGKVLFLKGEGSHQTYCSTYNLESSRAHNQKDDVSCHTAISRYESILSPRLNGRPVPIEEGIFKATVRIYILTPRSSSLFRVTVH